MTFFSLSKEVRARFKYLDLTWRVKMENKGCRSRAAQRHTRSMPVVREGMELRSIFITDYQPAEGTSEPQGDFPAFDTWKI